MKKAFIGKNNKRLRIAIFNWRDIKNPTSGGAEITTHEIARRLVARGHKIIQFSSSFKNAPNYEVVDGVEIYRKGNPFTVHLYGFFFYQKNLKGRVDIIIDQIHGLPFFTPLYVKEPKISYIHEVAGEIWFWEWPFPVSLVGFLIEKFYFTFYKNIPFITVSQSTKRNLIKYGISEKNIHIVKNGISPLPASFKQISKEKQPTLIYLGRISKVKRIEEIIKSLKIVQSKYPKIKLWIVGKGKLNYEKKLKKLDNKINLTKNIKFFGFVKEQKKFELLLKSWVICATSVKEGWGLTIVEAASVGTPAVVYNVSGLKDVVRDGQTGLICEDNTAKNLARNILKVISEERVRNELGQNAQKFAKTLSWDKTTNSFLKILSQKALAS